ncbi:MAG: hypothetical protein ABR512_15125 [Desulfopila sp.]
MNRLLFGIFILLLLYPLPSAAQYEGKSRYVTLVYSDKELLHDFNNQLILGRKLRYHLANKTIITVEDEVLAKLDTIIEKAETVLDMFPDKLHVTVVLLPSKKEVGAMYFSKYGKKVNHIAYYSLQEDTIYISVNDTKLRVIAHEIGHAIVDHYFQVRPPYTIHELMAQFTEKHITD